MKPKTNLFSYRILKLQGKKTSPVVAYREKIHDQKPIFSAVKSCISRHEINTTIVAVYR